MTAVYLCCDPQRLEQLRAYNQHHAPPGQLNAITSLEVVDGDYLGMGLPGRLAHGLRQRTLLVRCLLPVASLTAEQVRLVGGERITPITALWAAPADDLSHSQALTQERTWLAAFPDPERLLVVRTDQAGDFSRYRLELVASREDEEVLPHPGFDPRLWAIDFSFKAECPTDFDCRQPLQCPEGPADAPAISYLAKDYDSFRRLLLDRLSQLLPDWKPHSPADLGVTLVEWLAYVGDHLSYQQDAIATEAYLETCRSRISLRRHARLMDYSISEGCNARTWVQIEVGEDIEGTDDAPAVPTGTRLLTRLPGQPAAIADVDSWLAQADAVFETRQALTSLFEAHKAMPFHTWSDGDCCLPIGATAATLNGHFPGLRSGDVLILEEARSPVTGAQPDADRAKRHAVRLTQARAFQKIVGSGTGEPLIDPITAAAITEIEWGEADALPFALILSRPIGIGSSGEGEEGDTGVEDLCDAGVFAVARGNVVFADHGMTVPEEDLGRVEKSRVKVTAPAAADECTIREARPLPPRFRPRLTGRPLTHRCKFDPSLPASRSLLQDPSAAQPLDLQVRSKDDHQAGAEPESWDPRRDLLSSGSGDRHFVPEIESDGTVRLRFGNGIHGQRPTIDHRFSATCRVGNGTAGNVAAEAIAHIETPHTAIISVRNPLPAQGGTDPEPATAIRDRVPVAYRTQERAVTEADWGEVTARDPQVQRAAGRLRWTGSWYTAFVAVDPRGGGPLAEDFVRATRQRLERYRMAGQDLRVEAARTIPLELELEICVDAAYFRGDVKVALLRRFSNQQLPDGQLGVFHPDRWSFGQPVYLSRIYAAAQAVAGVVAVKALIFRRLGSRDSGGIPEGRLEFGPFEIPRLDNDPNFPEHGVLRLRLGGGK